MFHLHRSSWRFISQLIRYARACSYEYFILRARRLSSKLLKEGYLVSWNRHSESFMVDTGILFSNMTSPSQPLTNNDFTNFITLIPRLTFTELWLVSMEHLQRVWHASRERLPLRTPGSVPFIWGFHVLGLLRPIFPTLYRFNDRTELDFHRIEVSMTGWGMPTGSAYPSGHLVPSLLFGTCLCSYYWDHIPRTCHVFSWLYTLSIPLYFLVFAFYTFYLLFLKK